MPLTYMRRFIDDDAGYLDWLGANPSDFVINAARNPKAGHIVLHRAKCGSIGGARSRGSQWTRNSVKLCGNRNELEALAREDPANELRRCGLCLRGSAADSEREAPAEPDQARHAGAAHESSGAGTDPREVVLTGPEARAAWRPYRPWFSCGFALAAAAVLSGWLLWHRSAAQLTLLSIGCSALFIAAMVWRFGIIGFSYSTSGADTNFTRRLSPLPRKITTPVLAAAGLLSILAATSTTIGSVLSPVATAGITIWQFGTATWGLVLLAAFIGMATADLFSRKDRASAGCVLVFLIGSLLASYGLAWITGGFRQYWALTLEPFRDLWHLLGG